MVSVNHHTGNELENCIPMVKLKDLARELNVSITTVSRALNGFSDVNEETRARVVEAAERLGYRANMNARRLVTGRSHTIGLANPAESSLIHEAHIAEFLSGIGEALSESEYDLLLIPFKQDDEIERYKRAFASNRVDAVILGSILLDDPRVEFLNKVGMPFIVHGRTETKIPYAFIDIDNESVGYKSAIALLDTGHRRIGLLNGPASMTFARDREQGYRRALNERGIPFDPALTDNAMMADAHGYAATQRFFSLKKPATGLIAGSMANAIGAIRAVRTAGLILGKHISLIAHDDIFHFLKPDSMVPPLTTTTSSMRAAGHTAAELAIRLLDGEPVENLQQVWDVEFIERQSVGRAPDQG